MTCIVAKIYNGKVHMAADILGSNGFTKKEYPLIKKLFKNGDFIIGGTTSFRMLQLLQHYWVPPKKSLDDSDDKYIFKIVTDSLIKLFKDNDFGRKNNVDYEAGNFLVGWKGRLFEMQPDTSLLEHQDFAAVGCGVHHATAAMKTMDILGQLHEAPESYLSLAIRVAHEHTTGVSLAYDYLSE